MSRICSPLFQNDAMKKFNRIVLVIAASILPLLFIFYRADLPNRAENGFSRKFLPDSPQAIANLQLEDKAQGIIGKRQLEILFSTGRADHLIAVSPVNGSVRMMPTTSSRSAQQVLSDINTFAMCLGSNHLYLYDYSQTKLYALNAVTTELESTIHIGFFCSAVVPLHPNASIVRGYNARRASLLFGKISATGNTLWENDISLLSLDGGLSTDGQLLYDQQSNLLTYMHYYNNRVIVFDTLFQTKQKFTTLDTIAPKLKLDPAKPRLITNKTACVHDGMLYVCSNLRADNETYKAYMKNIPVDCYDVRTGVYLGSFYLPVDDGKVIRDIRVINGRLYTFYFSGRLSVFSLPCSLS